MLIEATKHKYDVENKMGNVSELHLLLHPTKCHDNKNNSSSLDISRACCCCRKSRRRSYLTAHIPLSRDIETLDLDPDKNNVSRERTCLPIQPIQSNGNQCFEINQNQQINFMEKQKLCQPHTHKYHLLSITMIITLIVIVAPQ